MNDELSLFRVYEPWESGVDGYPETWHGIHEEDVWWRLRRPVAGSLREKIRRGKFGVKDLVRDAAENQCQRCRHPFIVGADNSYETDGQPDVRATGGRLPTARLEMFADIEDVEPHLARSQGKTNWSACHAACTHRGPYRVRYRSGEAVVIDSDECAEAGFALTSDPDVVLAVEAAWRILTVHHLNGNKLDLRWWNLVALCQRCHLTIQRKVQMERVYPFEHTDWFKPYAAGWYAYAYLGENITRAEAEGRLDELLALERLA